MLRQRLAVERVRDERLRFRGVGDRQAAAELLRDLDHPAAEVDLFLASIRAEDHHFVGISFDPGAREQSAQRNAGPLAIARKTVDAPWAITRALKAGYELGSPDLSQFLERQ